MIDRTDHFMDWTIDKEYVRAVIHGSSMYGTDDVICSVETDGYIDSILLIEISSFRYQILLLNERFVKA